MYKSLISVFLFTFGTCIHSTSSAQYADKVLVGGNILTVDKEFTIAESLAIKGDRIQFVGDTADVENYIDENTEIILLGGKTVIPGLIDNHFHFIRGVWNFQTEARLDGIRSRETARQKIMKQAEQAGRGNWVTVMGGWTGNQFLDDSSAFSLEELDEIVPENPVFLMRNYSEGFANSLAFEMAQLDNNGDARVSGRNNVRKLVNMVSWRNKISPPDAILNYMAELNRIGLTTVYDVGRPSEGSLEPLQKLAESSVLPLRVFHTLRYRAVDKESTQTALEMIRGSELQPKSNNNQFGLLGLGEHIYVPVSDNPRYTGLWNNEDWGPFTEISYAAARNGWPVHEHVMSRDTAVQYLDLVTEIAETIPSVKDLRWTFAHVNGMKDEDIVRAAELGVALAVHSQARMSVRAADAPRIGSIARSGTLWGLGSDAGIVASYLPFDTLEWAVAGTNIAGAKTWTENQRVSRKEALIAHTRSNAELLFMEDQIGTLETGKLADLLVLDQNFMTINVEEISEIKPVLTISSGNIVYKEP